jgi:anti-anti-sigma factor
LGGVTTARDLGEGLRCATSPGRISFAGEIDLLTERAFREAVWAEARRQQRPIVVDLTALSYLDSGGITALYTLVQDPEVTISVEVRAHSTVDRLLQLSGLARVLTIVRQTVPEGA